MIRIRHLLPVITPAHRAAFRWTRGRLGGRLPGYRFLLLEHLGRKSGRKRRTPLLYVEVAHRYDAPVKDVWDAYTDHAHWREWAGTPGSRLVREGDLDRNGSGAVRAFTGGVREEILSFEPPKRMSYRVTAGMPMKNHQGEVIFEADGPGTRVTWRCEFECRIPGLGGVMRRGVESTFRRALRGLERHRFPPKSA